MTTTVHASSAVRTSAAAAPAFWRPAALAAIVAASATTAVAAVAQAGGVALAIDGEQIPLAGFAQLTLICAVIGIVLAAGLRRWARRPRVAFVRTTIALTALSLVPDVLVTASVDTKLTLMSTHLVAAAIVIPAIAARLGHRN
jgi:Family of unknown function (DUF6069)